MIALRFLRKLLLAVIPVFVGCSPGALDSDPTDTTVEATAPNDLRQSPLPHNPLLKMPATAMQAWKDAGATRLAWIYRGNQGSVGWVDDSYASVGDPPAFIFENGWNASTTTPLPDPGFPFGVVFRHLEEPDNALLQFVALAPFENLHALDLRSTAVTDVGMKKLKSLSNLQALSLGQTKITDEGLFELEPLTALIWLDLGDAASTIEDSHLTDKGLAHVGRITNLQFLCLSGSRVTADGMRELRPLEGLTGLGLYRTWITLRGLDELVVLNNLEYLDVRATGVRDEAGSLVQLKKLKTLHLERSFNQEELKKVRQALPKCEIYLQ